MSQLQNPPGFTIEFRTQQCEITTVAMESTGVYWIPLYEILESKGFEVKLVNARHVKNVPGRKTDVSDCQWLQKLHSYGLLEGSFRPAEDICILRSYVRQRDNLIKSGVDHVNRMQKALNLMNIHIHKVISDITGVSGRRIIESILNGERDPKKLALLKDSRIRADIRTIEQSLTGNYREEHIFSLKQEYELYKIFLNKIKECDQQIEKYLKTFENKIDNQTKTISPKKQKTRYNIGQCNTFDLHGHLYRISGVDLTTINGLNTLTVQTIISEVGLDPSRWHSEKHFTSWLGLAPNNKITGGKIKGTRTKKVVNRATQAFRQAALSLSKSKTALGAFFRRMKSKLGSPKAITATARKIACIFYRMLKNGKEYVDLGMNYYEEKYKNRVIKNLKNTAKMFGYELVEIE